jgi:signal transduction histidine kinase
MITKKLYFPIFILVLLCLSAIVSCTKKTVKKTESKNDSQYNSFIDNAEKYSAKQNYDSAFYYYNKAKSICEIPQDNNKIIYALLNSAIIQQNQGDYSGSETSSTEAISLFDRSTKSYYKCAVFNTLAINYQKLYDYENAVYYYKQSLKLAEDELQKTILKNNIAVVYLEQQNYQKAILMLLPLALQKETTKNNENYARILDNLGYSYFRLENIKSLSYLKQSLKIREAIKDNLGLIKSYIHLSEFYKNKNLQLSNRYSKQAYNKATAINNIDDRLKSLTLLMQNSAAIDYKEHSETYLRISDSLSQARQKAKNQFAKIKYDSKKEKDENQKLRLEKAENLLSLQEIKYQRILALIGIGFLILLILYLRKFYRNKNRIEKLEASYDTETRIAKTIHDELANDLFHAITYAETQSLTNESKKEVLLQKLDQIYLRVRGISRENNDIDTGENFSKNIKELLSTYNSENRNVIASNIEKVNWEGLDEIKKITIHRILQELMVNMKKHSEASLVVLKFGSNQDVTIDYVDNGKGREKNEIVKNGLQNMENRILAINGTITFETEPNKGFKVKIDLPK